MLEFMRQYGWVMAIIGIAVVAGLHVLVMKLIASADKPNPPNNDSIH